MRFEQSEGLDITYTEHSVNLLPVEVEEANIISYTHGMHLLSRQRSNVHRTSSFVKLHVPEVVVKSHSIAW